MSAPDQTQATPKERLSSLLDKSFTTVDLLICSYDTVGLTPVYKRLRSMPSQRVLIRELTKTDDRVKAVTEWLKTNHPNSYKQLHPPPVLRFPKSIQNRSPLLVIGLSLLVIMIGVVAAFLWLQSQPPPVVDLSNFCKPMERPTPLEVGIVAPFDQCVPNAWRNQNKVEIKTINQSFVEASRKIKALPYHVIVDGTCPATVNDEVDISFALKKFDKPDELYQPKIITGTGKLPDIEALGLALLSYQNGDYDEAMHQFDQLNGLFISADIGLLKGNIAFFQRKYTEAIKIYDDIVNIQRPHWSIAYNNRGVIKFNQGIDKQDRPVLGGREDFILALEHYHENDGSEIYLLALANASQSDMQDRAFELAKAKCDLASEHYGTHPYSNNCLASYYLFTFNEHEDTMSQDEKFALLRNLERHLVEEKQTDAPVVQHFLRAFSYYQRGNTLETTKHATLFQKRMAYRTCSPADEDYLRSSLWLNSN